MKTLAINLPAFHQIPENDEWWGKGFTEWDNVRRGKPFYSGHYQPIIPLNNNYYDLSKKENIVKQIKLAKEYDIYGFVYYHYWFGNGKKLFEKPLEIIRDDINIDYHYCLAWANETWKSTWHNEKLRTLLEQKYPGKKDWKLHIEYLLTFFKDNKYIKIDNKPVLFIYNAKQIPQYDEMILYFSRMCEQYGFNAIYTIEYITPQNPKLYSNISDAVFEFEPRYTAYFDISKVNLLKRFLSKKLKRPDYQSYDKLWHYINNRTRTYEGKTIFRGCFSGWDNSARKGRGSMIVKGKTPQKFKKYFQTFVSKNRKDASKEFCVINAWNEWGEGAYLEPDTKDGYEYLKAIKEVMSNER